MGNTLLSVGKIIRMNDHENGAFTTISLHKLARMGEGPWSGSTHQVLEQARYDNEEQLASFPSTTIVRDPHPILTQCHLPRNP